MFADDTKIWTKLTNPTDAESLQNDLDSLSTWSARWQLKFNPKKCKLMHIGHKQDTKYTIRQDNINWNIQEVSEERDLGCVAQLVERRSLTGELSLSCAGPAADG